MEAIESLGFEHRLIERVLGGLECFTQTLYGQDGREELGRFVRFLGGFADELHHGKEEGLLFERMGQVGFPKDSGPVAVMLHEHDAGRALVRAMDELARRPQPWTESEAGRVTESAAQFSALLRDHIRKEDRILYPMAEAHLSPEDLDRLGADFDRHATDHASAERDLTVPVAVSGDDEVQNLGRAFANMMETLRSITVEMRGATDRLLSASSELGGITRAQGESMARQATALEEARSTSTSLRTSSRSAAAPDERSRARLSRRLDFGEQLEREGH